MSDRELLTDINVTLKTPLPSPVSPCHPLQPSPVLTHCLRICSAPAHLRYAHYFTLDTWNANCIAYLHYGTYQLPLAQADFVKNLDKQFQASRAEQSFARSSYGSYGSKQAPAASSDTVASMVCSLSTTGLSVMLAFDVCVQTNQRLLVLSFITLADSVACNAHSLALNHHFILQ